jgi:outer membrane protein OmpA-like peptidoglycan-associated protein
MQARLDQNRLALEQQLEVVRAQRDDADARIEERIASLQSDHEAALEGRDQRINAMQARLDQNLEALEQQLEVVRAQRDSADARLEERLAELQREHEATLQALQERIAAGDVRVSQERLALGQQLDVVRGQRDQALVGDAGEALPQTIGGQEEAAEQSADAERSTPRTALLGEQAADLGGRVTEEGIVVNLGGDELQFQSGSAALPQRELPTLDRTADLLKSRPELTARIEGHTDSLGSAQINQALSQQRAEAVMQALVERGVAASRLTAVGQGAEKPIADNATTQGRSENRRVEIYVVAGEQVAGESKEASG